MALRRRALALAGAGGAGWYASNDVDSAWARGGRTLCYGALVGLDYKYGAVARLAPDAPERKEAMAATHERAARRILHVCQLHGGLYTKLGQFVASLTHILPAQYTTVLAACQDRANAVPFETARAAIEAELGRPLSELYRSFEPTPLAAASLAQVHRAVTQDGEPVAVKVQYPKLAAQMGADQQTLRALSWLVERAFPGCGYEWLLPEFEQSMAQELDFRREAANAARAARLLERVPNVYVPRTLAELSGRRVLTMEFVEGVKLSDPAGLAALRLSPSDLSSLLTATFSRMIFDGGFVHCDPHSGNLLARPQPGRRASGRPAAQLVILDHGLYRELDDGFRRHYCRLWYALLTREHDEGRVAAQALGVAPSDYDHLSLLLTFRPSGSRTALGTRLSAEERARVRQRFAHFGVADVSGFLERMPRDMLFVMRTWAYVRSLNRDLGGTTRARLALQGEYAARAVSEHARPPLLGQQGWLAALVDALRAHYHVYRVRFYLGFFDAAFRLLWAARGIVPHSSRDLG